MKPQYVPTSKGVGQDDSEVYEFVLVQLTGVHVDGTVLVGAGGVVVVVVVVSHRVDVVVVDREDSQSSSGPRHGQRK